ncbi:hypothetical protein VNO77_00328 [Canavalia gladiata]|uniref:Uncharacterized protein n=1 Tax=Canavalia gladiata TaxID=3824 RepID=A0AAN9R4A6_CANGL
MLWYNAWHIYQNMACIPQAHEAYVNKKKSSQNQEETTKEILLLLLLSKDLVEGLVLPVLDPVAQRESVAEKGVQVFIWDIDTQSIHNLVFKFWASSKSYIFVDGWIKNSVNRKKMKLDFTGILPRIAFIFLFLYVP